MPYFSNTTGVTLNGILQAVDDLVNDTNNQPYARNTNGSTSIDGVLDALTDLVNGADNTPYARNTGGLTTLDGWLDALTDLVEGSDNSPYESNTSGTVGDAILAALTDLVKGEDHTPYMTSIPATTQGSILTALTDLVQAGGISGAPTVQTFSPADNVFDVAIGANFVLTFNKPIQAGATASFRLYRADAVLIETWTQAAFGGAVVVSGSTVTINKATDLSDDASFYLLADAGSVEDLDANPWAGIVAATIWNFSTGIAPEALVIDVQAGSDTGSSSTDNKTNDNTPNILHTFTAGLQAGDKIHYFNGVSELAGSPRNVTQVQVDNRAAVVTMTQASPCVITWPDAAHRPPNGNSFTLSTTGALLTGLTPGATVFVINGSGATSNLSNTEGGSAVNTTGTQSGIHTAEVDLPHVLTALADGVFALNAVHFRNGVSAAASNTINLTIDTAAPTISTLSPADNATGVALNSNLVVTFNENIVAGATATITIKKTSDNTTLQTFTEANFGGTLVVSGATLTINPTDLANSLEVYVQIAAGSVTDVAGNSFAGISSTTAWSFTTAAETVAPTISTLSPADNATGVSVSANLVATFSESVQFHTAVVIGLFKTDDTLIELFDETDIGTLISISGAALTINPTSDLTASTGYYVQIGATSVKDLAGNFFAGIADETTWSFTTATGASWAPTDLGAALVGWYKADTGVYNDAGSTLATNGQDVQQWNDQSGNSHHLSQSNNLRQPTYGTGSFNSTHGLTFDGSLDALATAFGLSELSSKTTLSVYVVLKVVSDTGTTGRIAALTVSGSNDTAADGAALFYVANSTTLSLYQNGTAISQTIATGTNYRIGTIFDGTNVTYYRNNAQQSQTASTWTTSASSYSLSVGAKDSAGTNPSNIVVAEVIVTNTALSSGDRNSMDSYFQTKWGL